MLPKKKFWIQARKDRILTTKDRLSSIWLFLITLIASITNTRTFHLIAVNSLTPFTFPSAEKILQSKTLTSLMSIKKTNETKIEYVVINLLYSFPFEPYSLIYLQFAWWKELIVKSTDKNWDITAWLLKLQTLKKSIIVTQYDW